MSRGTRRHLLCRTPVVWRRRATCGNRGIMVPGIPTRYGDVIAMPEPSEQALHWATDAVGGGVRVAGVTGLREGANPWLLRFEPADRVETAVLRLGGLTNHGHCRRFATEVAAL